jgi:hypothetical protein
MNILLGVIQSVILPKIFFEDRFFFILFFWVFLWMTIFCKYYVLIYVTVTVI